MAAAAVAEALNAVAASPREAALAALAVLLTVLALRQAAGARRAAAPVAPAPPPPPAKKLTAADVAAHASRTDAWIIIGKGVYDVTPYVEEHPGGVAAILKNAGGDSTAGFHGPQHPARVFDMIEDFRIGDLVDA